MFDALINIQKMVCHGPNTSTKTVLGWSSVPGAGTSENDAPSSSPPAEYFCLGVADFAQSYNPSDATIENASGTAREGALYQAERWDAEGWHKEPL